MRLMMLLGAALVTLVLLGCEVGTARVVETLNQEFSTGGTPTIIVDSDAGRIELRTGAGDRVKVTAEKRAPSKGDARDIDVAITQDSGTVRAVFRRRNPAVSNRSVDFTITAPPDSRLQLKTAGGSVDVRGFRQGVDAETGGGSISVSDLKGAATLRTGGGSIEATGLEGSVDARAGGGSVTVGGRLTGENHAESGGGSVTVTVPADNRLRVQASTGAGSASNDFGFPVEGQGPRGFQGTIGDGSDGRLELRVGGGSVALRKS